MMWRKTADTTVTNDQGLTVQWLGYNYGVNVKEGLRSVYILAENGGDDMTINGQRVVTLYMGWDPRTRWNTGEKVAVADRHRLMETARDALQVIGIRAVITERGRWDLVKFARGLPWRARFGFLWSRLCRRFW